MSAQKRENTFRSVAIGFSITKPTSWNFVSANEVLEARKKVNFHDDELDGKLRRGIEAPLVAMKKRSPHRRLDPSVQVILRRLEALEHISARQILEIFIAGTQEQLPSFRVVEPVRETTLSGHPAAHVLAHNTILFEGQDQVPTTVRIWLVRRGDLVFTISMTHPQESSDALSYEFQGILDSVRIDS